MLTVTVTIIVATTTLSWLGLLKAFDTAFSRGDLPNQLIADSIWCTICDRVFWFQRLNIICDKFLFTFRSDYHFNDGVVKGRAYCVCIFSTEVSVLRFFVIHNIEDNGLYVTSSWEHPHDIHYLLPRLGVLYSVDNDDINTYIDKAVVTVRLWAFAIICAFVGYSVFVAAIVNLVLYA